MSLDSTRWTVIRGAAAGRPEDREEFVRTYRSAVRAYLRARWRTAPLREELEDAVQQVFLECFRTPGPLEHCDPERGGGFRAYLYGVVRNVARAFERRLRDAAPPRGDSVDLESLPTDDASLATLFDREWARTILREAAARHLQEARAKGEDALRRHRLLALRYGEDRPIREIALEWAVDAGWLHGQFKQARVEFHRALEAVVRERSGGGPAAIEAECRELLRHFS